MKMKASILNYVTLLSIIIILNSCTKDNPAPLDCNNIENGTSLLDDCGECQQAYIYNPVSHAVVLLDDTAGIVAPAGEIIIMPNDPMNPYWNSSCDDCNNIENGTSMIDDCGECQQAYIYNPVTHAVVLLDDTAGIVAPAGEMIIMPNDPMNPYWNASCVTTTGTVAELNASNYTVDPSSGTLSGDFVKFNFSEESIVTEDNWDVAFRGTTIIINGGLSSNIDQPTRTGNAAVYIANGTMSSINEVDELSLLQDNSTSPAIADDFGFTGLGWCTYDMTSHVISPIAGKILVFRTHDNKYAKLEILNFYDNPMTSQYGGFYTFNYTLTGGSTTF